MAKRSASKRKVSVISEGLSVITSSAEQTRDFGRYVAGLLRPGDIVYLTGGLGCGKTTFVQGVVEAFGNKKRARSSSFILVNEYKGPGCKLCHMDLYRLEGGEMDGIGLEDILDGSNICLIEWADKVKHVKGPVWEIELVWRGESEREIRMVSFPKKRRAV